MCNRMSLTIRIITRMRAGPGSVEDVRRIIARFRITIVNRIIDQIRIVSDNSVICWINQIFLDSFIFDTLKMPPYLPTL